MVRRYAEEQLLLITRRYVKKFGNPEPGDSVVGYKRFGEVCRDLDSIINVLWRSGTRKYLYAQYLWRETNCYHSDTSNSLLTTSH
jgi:hypothetical protein